MFVSHSQYVQQSQWLSLKKKKRCKHLLEWVLNLSNRERSGFFSSDTRATGRPELSQGCHGETSWFSEDFLGKARETGIKGLLKGKVISLIFHPVKWLVMIFKSCRGFYLHECVTLLYKLSVCDLLEALADVRQWLGLLNQILVVMDQSQSYAEQDFRALVEQAIPDPQNSLGKAAEKHWIPTTK